MPVCFVIQPFDNGKFDERFNDIYKPALEEADFEVYRVDHDSGVEVPILAIEDGIRNANICLADITTDNPNVWYELGFAFAVNRPVIMICSSERQGGFPFDIQHRAVIKYSPDSPSSFEKLKNQITVKAQALFKTSDALQQVKEAEQTTPIGGLSPLEIMVLATLVGETAVPGSVAYLHSLERDVKRSGITSIGFGLAIRELIDKEFVNLAKINDQDYGEPADFNGVQISPVGWKWIQQNDSRFILKVNDDIGDIPW